MRNLAEPLLAAIDAVMSELHVCLPGRIEKYEHTKQRAQVKPLLRRNYRNGEIQEMPVIAGVPVVFPRSGGASFTMPVKRGDGVLLLFADRSLDSWLLSGGSVTPDDRRKHDISDCIAIPGLYSFSDTSPQDNNDDVLLQYAGGEFRILPSGEIKMNGATVTSGGDVVTASGISLDEHTHGPGTFVDGDGAPVTGESDVPQ